MKKCGWGYVEFGKSTLLVECECKERGMQSSMVGC